MGKSFLLQWQSYQFLIWRCCRGQMRMDNVLMKKEKRLQTVQFSKCPEFSDLQMTEHWRITESLYIYFKIYQQSRSKQTILQQVADLEGQYLHLFFRLQTPGLAQLEDCQRCLYRCPFNFKLLFVVSMPLLFSWRSVSFSKFWKTSLFQYPFYQETIFSQIASINETPTDHAGQPAL